MSRLSSFKTFTRTNVIHKQIVLSHFEPFLFVDVDREKDRKRDGDSPENVDVNATKGIVAHIEQGPRQVHENVQKNGNPQAVPFHIEPGKPYGTHGRHDKNTGGLAEACALIQVAHAK